MQLNKEKLENAIIAALREINITNAAHSAPVYSHKEILELRSITLLRRFGKLLRVKYYGKLPKQELIPWIVDAMKQPAKLRLFLNELDKTEWDFFLNAIAQKEIQADYFSIDCYLSAQHLGILQSFYHENQLYVVVPNEIKTTFEQLKESGYVDEKDFRNNLAGFAIAAINLYGVISQCAKQYKAMAQLWSYSKRACRVVRQVENPSLPIKSICSNRESW